MHSPSTKMDGKLKLRKAGLTLAMHLKVNFSSTVTRVTLEWLICIPIYMVKSTDWFKKRAAANGLVIGCKFAPSLV